MNYNQIIDISPVIRSTTAVFPGDQKFERNVVMDMSKGDHLGLSTLTSTLHIGAHADSTNHYHKTGQGIDQLPLKPYLGACQVIDLSDQFSQRADRILVEDIATVKIQADRILFKTNSFANPDLWKNEFVSLSPQLIHYLKSKNVLLVGIDTPSVDPWDSKELESHAALFETDMRVLEGVILENVSAGLYDLIALPLRIEDADASPVRAVLLPLR